jgi:hypothetical protein
MLRMTDKTQSKIPQKLAMAAVFLVAVAFVVGGQNAPGVLTMAQKQGEQKMADDRAEKIAQEAPPAAAKTPSQEATSDWYAEVSPGYGGGTAPRPDEKAVMSINEETEAQANSLTGSSPRAGAASNASRQGPDEGYDDSEWETLK